MRRWRLNSGYNGATDQRRTAAGTIPAMKHYMERGLGEFEFTTVWTPAQLSPAMWFDADDASTITLNGSNVSQWDDKSGNGRNATQATAANQPAYTTAGLNGKNVVTFDGSDNGDILTTNYNLSDTHTIVLVSKAGTQTSLPASGIRPLVMSTTTGGGLLRGIGAFRQGLSSPLIDALDILIDNTRLTGVKDSWLPDEVIIASDTYDGSTLSAWKNGSTYSTPLSVVRTGFGKLQIGGVDDISVRRFAGTLAEVVVLDTSASTENRQKLEGYLAHKWGLAANLPANHPYKTAPPL